MFSRNPFLSDSHRSRELLNQRGDTMKTDKTAHAIDPSDSNNCSAIYDIIEFMDKQIAAAKERAALIALSARAEVARSIH